MNLDCVTITGADDSVSPRALAALSAQYPFVEWGILVSQKQSGVSPRFPTGRFVAQLQDLAQETPLKLSLHLCGHWVRRLLVGANEVPPGLLDRFQRVQLNFHAESLAVDRAAFHAALPMLGERQIIFQIDGNQGETLYNDALGTDGADCVPLFDVSHGAGTLPDNWPEPFRRIEYHGYAGGLGPDNLAEQIPLIGAAAGDARIWIDMETRVRSDNDRQFDLAKVQRCLALAAPFVR